MHKIKLDDGFYPYLVDGAAIVGAPGIPMLMDLHNAQVPRQLIPFEKIRQVPSKRGYVHFYMHDRYFERMLTSTTDYLDLLKQFDGVITPDCSLLVGQSACLQQTNTYFNRAVLRDCIFCLRLAVLLLRCAVGFDAFVAQIQGFDRRSNGPYLRDIAGGFRDLNEAFAVDVDYFLDKLKMS